MKLYNVGLDEFFDYDLSYVGNEYDWFVYAYYNNGYDGEGEAVGYKDGNLYFYNLSHCSCYGPLEGSPQVITVDNWLNSNDIHDADTRYKEVRDKLVELLS